MGFLSPLTWVITIVTLLITPLITTHEPPSKVSERLSFAHLAHQGRARGVVVGVDAVAVVNAPLPRSLEVRAQDRLALLCFRRRQGNRAGLNLFVHPQHGSSSTSSRTCRRQTGGCWRPASKTSSLSPGKHVLELYEALHPTPEHP